MEKRKKVFDFFGQVLAGFSITVLALIFLTKAFGREAEGYSSIFSMGEQGISCDTLLEFFSLSVIMTFISRLFFSELIKKIGVLGRTLCMLVCDVAMVAWFTCRFGWFPVDDWKPWCMFFLCFFLCFIVSMAVSILKEKTENAALEEALKKLQKEDKDGVSDEN